MSESTLFGPTYAEMRDPRLDTGAARERLRTRRAQAARLFDLHWQRAGHLDYVLVPSEMTGTTAPMCVVAARSFPHGTAASAIAYGMLAERQVNGALDPARDAFIAAPADDFAVGAAFAADALGYPFTVLVEAGARPEIVAALRSADATIEDFPGDAAAAAREARRRDDAGGVIFLEPRHEFSAYRFANATLGPLLIEQTRAFVAEHVGRGRIDAFVAGLDDPAILATGAVLKEHFPACRVVGAGDALEVERWTQTADAGRTWPLILDPDLLDAVGGVDRDVVLGYLRLLARHPKILVEEGFTPMEQVDLLVDFFGVAAMRNLFAAVKVARARHFTHEHLVVTVAPAGLAYDKSILDAHAGRAGKLAFTDAVARIEWLRECDAGGVFEVTPALRDRWRSQHRASWMACGPDPKAYDALVNPAGWRAQRELADAIDRQITALR
jgi:cysteine synthase